MYDTIDSFEKQADVLILLIHGTFAKNAPWTSKHSFFSQQLKEKVNQKYDQAAFTWGGKNSHHSRINGGEELAYYIEKCVEKGYKKIILIGHSHGGNVILYALKNIKTDKVKIEVITLATPFINTTIKERGSNLSYLVFISILRPIFIFATTYIIILFLYSYLFDKELFMYKPSFVERSLLLISFWVPIIAIYNRYKTKVKEKIWQQIQNNYEKISTISKSNVRILVTYIDGDKVKGWVSVWVKMSTILINFYDKYRLLTEFTWKKTDRYLIFALLGLVFLGFFGVNSEMVINIFVYGITAIFLIFLLYCIFNFMLRFIMILKESNFLILGYTSYKYRIFFNFDISHIPHHLTNRKVIKYNIPGFFSTKHSEIYNDKNAIKDIVSWINEEAQ